MVWLGDSTAAGVGATDADQAIPRRVAAALDRPVDLTSLAVSGDRVADVVADQVDALADLDPDVVLVSIGANDVVHLTSRADFRDGYERARRRGPGWRAARAPRRPRHGRPAPLPAAAASASPRPGAASSTGSAPTSPAIMVRCTSTSRARRARPCARDTDRYFARDRYHPSDDGYALWADAVLDRAPARPSPSGRGDDAVDDMAARGFEAGAAAYEAGPARVPRRRHRGPGAASSAWPPAPACATWPRAPASSPAASSSSAPSVVAVEPVDGMREQLLAAVPGVEAVDGTAESIPLPDALGRRGDGRAGVPLVRRPRRAGRDRPRAQARRGTGHPLERAGRVGGVGRRDEPHHPLARAHRVPRTSTSAGPTWWRPPSGSRRSRRRRSAGSSR